MALRYRRTASSSRPSSKAFSPSVFSSPRLDQRIGPCRPCSTRRSRPTGPSSTTPAGSPHRVAPRPSSPCCTLFGQRACLGTGAQLAQPRRDFHQRLGTASLGGQIDIEEFLPVQLPSQPVVNPAQDKRYSSVSHAIPLIARKTCSAASQLHLPHRRVRLPSVGALEHHDPQFQRHGHDGRLALQPILRGGQLRDRS